MTTGGLFLYNKLAQKLPGVLAKRYRELKFENGSIVPTEADLKAGAAEVVRDTMSEIGDAEIIGDGAFDMPVVDVSAGEDRYKTIMVGSAFSYTFQQERAFELGNAELTDRRMFAARRSIAERHNQLSAYGDARVGITGMLNNASVMLNNSSFNANTASSDDLTGFFVDELKAAHRNSNNVEMPMDVLIPTGLFFLLIKKRVADSAQSALTYIKLALSEEDIKFNLIKCEEVDSANLEARGVQAGGTNKDRVTFFVKDPEVIERHIELTQLMPAEWVSVKSGRRVYPMFSCTTPTIINYPGAMRYIDIPKVN